MADTVKPRTLPETASQTAGPYVHIGLAPSATGLHVYEQELGQGIVAPDATGARIHVSGHVFDGAGAVVTDALIEIWQADAEGQYRPEPTNGFRGWGRAVTDFETGLWQIETIRPGAVRDATGLVHAPHLTLWIVARGVNLGLATRLYFADAAEANAADPTLATVPETRRTTLLAHPHGPETPMAYQFDIRLQGSDETVFFDI